MNEIRKLIRKTLLNGFLIKENLDRVISKTGISDGSKVMAETWAEEINNRGRFTTLSLKKDSANFNITFYMLEILMYAILNQESGIFTFPTTKKTINVNAEKISQGIAVFVSPTHDLNKFAAFLSKDTGFTITGDELEALDSQDALGLIENTLQKMPNIIKGYLSNNYFEGSNHAFALYLITAIKWPLGRLRKKTANTRTSSLDEPMFGGEKTRNDVTSDYDGDFGVTDKEVPYSPGVIDANTDPEERQEINNIFALNFRINELIKKDFTKQFFKLRVVGEGGSETNIGKTYTHLGIMKKYANGGLDTNYRELKEDIGKRVKTAANTFLQTNPKNLPAESMTELSELINLTQSGSKEALTKLVGFLLINAVGTKYTPLILLKRIRKDIQQTFESRPALLDAEVNAAKLVNPDTNKFFTGMEYLNRVLKARTSSNSEEDVTPMAAPVAANSEVSLTEDMIYEELINETEEDTSFTFNDVLSIAKATVNAKKHNIQETRNSIRKIILKSITK